VSSVKPGAPQARSLSVPFLVNPEHKDIVEHVEKRRFFWLDLIGPTDEKIDQLAETFGLHPLTVEDARTFHQRPKLEEFAGYVFLVAYGVDPGTSSGQPLLREIHIIVSGEYVITIHRHPFTALEELHDRYENQQIRSELFLVYKILDAVTATFLPVLTRIDDDIDEIEQDVISEPTEEILTRIFSLKRDLVAMRRVVTPQRDVFARDAERIAEIHGLQSDERLYFRDLYDTQVRVSDLIDSYRDLLSGATDLYLSTVANRQGEVNKTLTMIATVFLPLTFLTGFFGQNFSFLTGHVLNTTWSFIVFGLGLLILSIVGFVAYFKHKRWM
jgi:magnesium transporter